MLAGVCPAVLKTEFLDRRHRFGSYHFSLGWLASAAERIGQHLQREIGVGANVNGRGQRAASYPRLTCLRQTVATGHRNLQPAFPLGCGNFRETLFWRLRPCCRPALRPGRCAIPARCAAAAMNSRRDRRSPRSNWRASFSQRCSTGASGSFLWFALSRPNCSPDLRYTASIRPAAAAWQIAFLESCRLPHDRN